MSNFLNFDQLENGKMYRVLHNGEKDHGYSYCLNAGRLYNFDKQRFSSLGFNKNIKFIDENKKFYKVESLEFPIEFHSRGIKIGCQNITNSDALLIALEIMDRLTIDGSL